MNRLFLFAYYFKIMYVIANIARIIYPAISILSKNLSAFSNDCISSAKLLWGLIDLTFSLTIRLATFLGVDCFFMLFVYRVI